MQKKIAVVVVASLCLIMGISTIAFSTTVVNSKHDFSSQNFATFEGGNPSNFAGNFSKGGFPVDETCVFCHTPHGARPAAEAGPLWNRTNSTAASYKMYTSITMTTAINMGSAPTGLTMMCMSCHDGVTSIAAGSLLAAPGGGSGSLVTATGFDQVGDVWWPNIFTNFQWGANIGNITPQQPSGSPTGGPYGDEADLSNDHPVSFAWVNGITGIKDPSTWTGPAANLKLFGGSQRMECSTCHEVHDSTLPPFLRMANTGSAMCLSCHDK